VQDIAAFKFGKVVSSTVIGWVWQFTLQSAQRHNQISNIGDITNQYSEKEAKMCTKESRILYGAAKPLAGQQRLFTKKLSPPATTKQFYTDEGSLFYL
jgi:hypothetical protein